VTGFDRAIAAAGAVAGLLGVALSAMATHGASGGQLDIAARFLLVHAPALLALAALAAGGLIGPRAARLGGLLLILGLLLFCGDLTRRAYAGIPLAPYAAPAGGLALMAGWALAGIAALLRRR
jgi:uncharacterized membrane protein YgdD (TMEM256/DUF423 family)